MKKASPMVVFLVACAPSLLAQQIGPTIHVFGGWAYGKTDGNAYLAGTHAGEYDNVSVAVNVAASPAEKVHLEGQLFADIVRGVKETSIDYAFGEWRFSDALRLRAGRIKHPFGIYNEVHDVGTLRPFFSLAQAVYGPVGTLAKAYNGLGVSGLRKLGAWSVMYDAYAGELDLPYDDFEAGSTATTKEMLDVKNVVGGRAVLETPIQGLSFGGSAYAGTISPDDSKLRKRHRAAGVQIEYATDCLSLRGEWTRNRTGEEDERAGYLESALRLTPHWQVAARHGALQESADRSNTGRHRETAVSINYWFTRQFVLKLSGHHVGGIHLAQPDPGTGTASEHTRLLMFGAQFSF